MLPKFDPTNQKACLSLLEDTTSNAKQIQDSVLEAILSRNAQTEYLRGFLNGQVDKQSFKKNLPFVTYEDYRSYIDLSSIPLCICKKSSGTSGGVPKLIPLTAEELEQRMLYVSLCRPIFFKHIKGRNEGKSLIFYFETTESETASGLIVSVITFLNG
ncbi:Auxin-responsive GH3 family protein [Raphanus sativus]|nr:Auxin-responsive GH3 family protein [Raphanus sativus]